MMLKNKDFKDYTNERIEKLEEEIKKLHEIFQTLQLNIDKTVIQERNIGNEVIQCTICKSVFNASADQQLLQNHVNSKHIKTSLIECFPTYSEMLEDDEEDDDDESSVEVEVPIKTVTTKKVISTKVKNGRQNISKALNY
jgi:hypothetical protein